MPVYVVVVTDGDVAEQIAALPSRAHKIADNSWLVKHDGTTVELAEAVGIRLTDRASGIAFRISNYSGRASSATWEWLELNLRERAD